MSSSQKNNALTPEQLQLLECLRAYIHGEKARCIIDPADPESTEALFSLAFIHKLVPVVADTLAAGDERFSGEQIKGWLQIAKKQAVMQTYIRDTFRTFYQKLGEKGFTPVVLKGELCRRLYEKGELRVSSDEDIYLKFDEAASCADAMLDMGFFGPSGSGEEAAPQWDGNGVMALNSPDGLHIELHRELFSDSRVSKELAARFENAAAVISDDGACPIRCFAPTDELLYLICHAAKHFAGSGFGIRTAGDIAAYTMRFYGEIDLDLLDSLLTSNGLRGFAAAVYGMAAEYLGYDAERYPIPMLSGKAADHTDLLLDCMEGGVYGNSSRARAQSAKYTAAVSGGGSNAKTALRAVFPPRKELEADYPFLKKSPLLLPAAWAKRIFNYIRAGRKDGQMGAMIGKRRAKLLKKYGMYDKK